MKFVIRGRVLNIHTGTSKTTNKDYTVADIYDGTDLVKVFGVDSNKLLIGEDTEVNVRLDIDWDKKRTFVVAVK